MWVCFSLIGTKFVRLIRFCVQTGKEYDDVGNVNPWWTNKTKTEFENRTNCFVDYYGSFSLPGSEEKVGMNRRSYICLNCKQTFYKIDNSF